MSDKKIIYVYPNIESQTKFVLYENSDYDYFGGVMGQYELANIIKDLSKNYSEILNELQDREMT